jgi:hypothetical protein
MTIGIETSHLLQIAGNLVKDAGIDNFSFDKDMLVMCGVRYVIDACECGSDDCKGVRLRRAGALDSGSLLQ